jgi:hypothetical protein
MAYFELNEKSVTRLHELADLQHPHYKKGDNHIIILIDKVYKGEKLSNTEIFDCGKYYQRMFSQLNDFNDNNALYGEYLHAILEFKWSIKNI